MSIRGIYNTDGEPLGIEHVYHDDYDEDLWYAADHLLDDGPFPGCCKRGDWGGWKGGGHATEADDPARLWVCVHCGNVGTSTELKGT